MGVLIRTSGRPDAVRRKIYESHKQGHLRKLAPGVFARREELDPLPPWDRYRLRCAAVGYAYPNHTLVGKSAAAIWEIPYGEVPGHVDIAKMHGTGGLKNPQIRLRRLRLFPGEQSQLHRGLHVTSLLQTVLDLGRWESLGDAVTASDHCLRERIFTSQQLDALVMQSKRIKGVSKLRDLHLVTHAASESPRESALRAAMWEKGFPAPELQASILNHAGQFLGRTDMLFADHSVLVEYDGESKYTGAFGESTEKALREERRREKELLNLGTRMVRVTAETFRDGRWVADLRRELELGKGRTLDPGLWSSQGLGWGTPDEKKPRGSVYRL